MSNERTKSRIIHRVPMVILHSNSAKGVNTNVVLEFRHDGTVTWSEKVKR